MSVTIHGFPSAIAVAFTKSEPTNRALDRLPRAGTHELRAQARTRAANALAVECELPTRLGRFRAMAHAESDSAAPILALVHGDPRPSLRARRLGGPQGCEPS